MIALKYVMIIYKYYCIMKKIYIGNDPTLSEKQNCHYYRRVGGCN